MVRRLVFGRQYQKRPRLEFGMFDLSDRMRRALPGERLFPLRADHIGPRPEVLPAAVDLVGADGRGGRVALFGDRRFERPGIGEDFTAAFDRRPFRAPLHLKIKIHGAVHSRRDQRHQLVAVPQFAGRAREQRNLIARLVEK